MSGCPFLSAIISPEPQLNANRREASLFALAFAFVTLAAGALALAPAARAGSWSELGGRWQHLIVVPVWLGCVWAVRRFAVRHIPHRDPLLLPLGYLLAGWGALMIWRLLPEFGLRQTGWLIVATVLLIAIVRGPTDLTWLRRYRHLWLAGGLFLTGLTLFFGTNPSGVEPRLWLGCCGLYFQPSEPLRLLLVAYLAAYIADRTPLSRGQDEPLLLSLLGPLVVVWGLSTLLLFVQRDLGTGSLFIGLLAIMLYVATRRRVILALSAGLVLLAGLFGTLSFAVVAQRVQAWLNPWSDPLGVGYQLIQSLMALANGGVFGKGLGMGAPGVVPATHTDFIFSAVAEEWGLIGALALIGLIAALVGRGLRSAGRAADSFHVVLATGLAAGLGLQSILIIGGVMRVLPLTGVTLPFVSYGGSSLVTSFAALAFLLLASDSPSGTNRFRPSIERVQLGMSVGWLLLALVAGWWGFVRATDLLARGDNPRRALESQFVPRGAILDRHGTTLVETIGEPGNYQRHYPQPASASLVGYLSPFYGSSGLEQSLDDYLRGEVGHEPLVELRQRLLTGSPPSGLDVRLTVEQELQAAAVTALEGQRGAALVIEANSGEVWAMASAPTFDPAEVEQRWQELLGRDDAPLLNRPAQARYQPGMALAPLLYAWTLEHEPELAVGEIDALSEPLLIEDGLLRCARSTSPTLTGSLEDALRLACPAPFAQLGQELGAESLRQMATAFGLDEGMALRLETAEPGSPVFAAEGHELRFASIGQAELNLTPLLLARAYAALAADGEAPPLHLLDALRVPGRAWRAAEPLGSPRQAISAQSASSTLAAFERTPGGWREYAAAALSGAEGEGLAWYLGVPPAASQRWVVLVVLEGATPDQVRQAATPLMRTVVGAGP